MELCYLGGGFQSPSKLPWRYFTGNGGWEPLPHNV